MAAKICIDDLKHKCTIEKRAMGAPGVGQYSAVENFTLVYTGWFKINTGFSRFSGVARFSGVNIDKNTTHLITGRYRIALKDLDGVGEHFIHYKDKYYRILSVTNLNEESDWLLFQCSERGDDSKKSTNA